VYQGDYPLAPYLANPPALTGTYALIILRVRDPGVYRILITNQLPQQPHHTGRGGTSSDTPAGCQAR
jgi:hypothetical protein